MSHGSFLGSFVHSSRELLHAIVILKEAWFCWLKLKPNSIGNKSIKSGSSSLVAKAKQSGVFQHYWWVSGFII